MSSRGIKYAKLESSELWSDREIVTRSWKIRSEAVERSEVESIFVVKEKEMILRCLL